MKIDKLKVHRFITTDELFPKANAGVLHYEKSEVDKVIAELEESHKMEVEQLLMKIAELKADYKEARDRLQTANLIKDEKLAAARHHKYKRCLANAEACMHKRWRPDEGFDYARSTRHMNKWLELSEKFKPNN